MIYNRMKPKLIDVPYELIAYEAFTQFSQKN